MEAKASMVFHNLSIKRKLILISMVVSCAALLLISVLFVSSELASYRTGLLRNLSMRAEIIGSSSTAALSFEDPKPVEEVLAALKADPYLVAACILQTNGALFTTPYRRTSQTEQFAVPSVRPDGSYIEGERIHFFRGIIQNNQRIGTVYMLSDLKELHDYFQRLLRMLALALLVALGFAFGLSSRLQRVISRPVLHLATVANTVASQKDYAVRAVKQGDDELGHLIDGFNDMLSQIQDRDTALQKIQAELEQRVDERTSELSNANRLLREEITEREQAEHALRQSEERFARAFQANPLPVHITSLVEDRFIDVNESFLRLVGFSRQEVIGQRARELGVWLDPAEQAHLAQRAKLELSVRDCEVRMRTKSGEIRNTLASIELITLGQEPCLLWISHDLTERLQLEDQLRQAQKMEAVGQLAAGVAHDFNNILTVIMGHTNLLQSACKTDPGMAGSLEEITASTERAANLVRQLLTFSRKQPIQPKTLDMNKVVANLAKMLGRSLGEHIALECRYAPTPLAVQADIGMMEQIILNLAVNARDAMPKGGNLTVTTLAIEVAEHDLPRQPQARPGHFVRLRVQDNGVGMDAKTLERIFEPFFTTKEVGKGTGLGLATVYGIVAQHKGWIEVASQPGRGSTFDIYLPSQSQIVIPSADAARPSGSMAGSETILVVEDEMAMRLMVRQVLRRYGYRILGAANGIEALRVWQEQNGKVDLLLTDMVMPGGLSGRDLADKLLAEKADLRVVYVSGYSLDFVNQGLNLRKGMRFLPKPFQPESLVQAVRDCLDGKDADSPESSPVERG